jgi:hypothetical protein
MARGGNTPSCVKFLLEYGRLEWQRSLHDLEKVPNVAYQDVLTEFDLVCCVKGLIVTCSNLMVTWKLRPQMGIVS